MTTSRGRAHRGAHVAWVSRSDLIECILRKRAQHGCCMLPACTVMAYMLLAAQALAMNESTKDAWLGIGAAHHNKERRVSCRFICAKRQPHWCNRTKSFSCSM